MIIQTASHFCSRPRSLEQGRFGCSQFTSLAGVALVARSHQFGRVISCLETLQEMTQLPFEISEHIRREPGSTWQPVFRDVGHVLHYEVETSLGIQLHGNLSGEEQVRNQARRLIVLACGQMRAEESNLQLQSDLASMTEHLHDLYEHVTVLHEVARTVSLEQDLETSISTVIQELEQAISAEIHLSESHASLHEVRCTGEPFKLQQSHSLDRSKARLLAVPLHPRPTEQRLLSARRPASEPEFGSQEELVLRSVATLLETHLTNASLFEEKDRMLLTFVRSMVFALDARDHYTCGHSERVALLSRFLAERMGNPREFSDRIYTSGLLHDVGKIGIRDHVLKKRGPLTGPQRKEIERHPLIGYQILAGIPAFTELLPGVRSHHERWDGKGYPDGLVGNEIPAMARIMAVADAFDAMASDRPYRPGMPLERVDEILMQGAGTQWCPDVIAAYCRHQDEFAHLWLEHHTRTNFDDVPLNNAVEQRLMRYAAAR